MISEGAAESQLPVDSIHHDGVRGGRNALHLLHVVWLVVWAEGESAIACLGQYSSAVAWISAIYFIFGDKGDAGCATSIQGILLFWEIFVYLHESFFERLFVISRFELFIFNELLLKHVFRVISNLFATVSVEDTKQLSITALDFHRLTDVRVLHATAPALHTACAPVKLFVLPGFRVLIFDRWI